MKLLRDEATTLEARTFDLRDAELDALESPNGADRGGARRMIGRFTVGATAAAVGGLAIAAVLFVRLALEWPAEEPRMIQGRQMLEATGSVITFDWASVVIAPTRLGLNGRRFVLEPETRVLVGDREGGIGDLRVGATVSVIYERHPKGFVARWLGLNVDSEALRVTALRSDVTEPEKPPRPIPDPPKVDARVEPASASQPSPAPPKADARVEQTRPRPAAPPRAEQPAPVDASSEDPGAVIDWLLSESKRR